METRRISFFCCISWPCLITLIQKMGRKRIKGTKYNRVTKQQKYIFLKLCISQKQSIHEAAFNSGIHYSTAKTILFFHKKQYKNYSTYIVNDPTEKSEFTKALQATWKELPINVDQGHQEGPNIEIIVNEKKKLIEERNRIRQGEDSSQFQGDGEAMMVKIQHDQVQPFNKQKEQKEYEEEDILKMPNRLNHPSSDNNLRDKIRSNDALC